MSIKKSLSLILFSFIFSLIVFFVFLIFVDPEEIGFLGLAVFLVSGFLIILSFFTLIFITLKIRRTKDKKIIFEKIFPSFRSAIIISFFIIGLIILNRFELLNWWTLAALLVFIILLEIIFSLNKKKIDYLEDES